MPTITKIAAVAGHSRITMCVGDSITLGGPPVAGDIGGYRTPLFKMNPGLVYRGSLYSYGEHNGYSGLRIDQISPLVLPIVAGFGPSMILLMAGTNDIHQGESGAATFTELQAFATSLIGISGVQKVLVSTIPWLNSERTEQLAYNALITGWASPPAGVIPVDAAGALVYPDDFQDTLHPSSPAGYFKLAQGWSPYVGAQL